MFRRLLLLVAVVLIGNSAHADITYYENQAAWQNDAGPDIRDLDLFDAMIVALADEVGSEPTDNQLLGTGVLTFSPTETGFGKSFQLSLLESSDFRFQNSGTRVGLEPASSAQEDFEQTIGGDGTFALAMQLEEHQANNTQWEFFDAFDNSLGSFVLSNGGSGAKFYGVVSDTKIKRAVVRHVTSENFAIGNQYFAGTAAVPEPSVVLLLGIVSAGCMVRRRRSKPLR